MNEHIGSYEAINLLRANGIIDDDDAIQCHSNLLKDIIEDFKSEVEE